MTDVRWPLPSMMQVACVGLLAAPPVWADDEVCDVVLDGQVFDAFTDEPVPDARVLVADGHGDTHVPAITNAAGVFRIEGLCPGEHVLVIDREGYAHLHNDITLPAEHLHIHLEELVEEVVVQTARLGTDDTRSSTTLSGEALERTRGMGLAEAVASVPGVTVMRGTSDNAKPIIRGQYGRRLLTLFDGVRHEGQKWGLDHGPEIDPFAADRITVVKGAAGVRYGPDAIGGVLLIGPRPLRDAPGADGEAHFVEMWNGLRTTGALRVDGAPRQVRGLAWRLEGNLAKGASVRSPDYVLSNTGSEQFNLGATLGYTRDTWEVMASYRHHGMRAGVCNCIANSTSDEFFAQLERGMPVGASDARLSFDIARPHQQVSHDLVLARAQGELGQAGTLEATYSFQINRREEFERARAAVTGPQFDFTLRTHQLELTFHHAPQAVGRSAKIEGTVGASGAFQENVYTGLPLIPNYRQGTVGVFVFERLWSRRLELEVGARYDHASQTTFLTDTAFRRHEARDRLSQDDCALGDDVATCDLAYHAGSVSLGGMWRAVEDVLSFKLDLSSASRFPDADELYMNGTAPTFPIYGLGDPSLGVETTWGTSLTALLDLPWVVGEVSGYANVITNYIYFGPELAPDGTPAFDVVSRGAFPRFSYRPVDAVFYGVDGGLTLGPLAPVEVALAASIVRADDLTNGGFLAFVPPDRGKATVTYKAPDVGNLRKTFVSLSGEYVAMQTRVDPAADLAPPPGDFFLLGFAVGTQLRFGDEVLKLAFEGSNVLDTRYRDYTSLLRYYADEPGRDFLLRASVQFVL